MPVKSPLSDFCRRANVADSNIFQNLVIRNNYVETCWDSPINIISEFYLCKGSRIEGILIEENELGFGIAGIYLFANAPTLCDSCDGGVIKNVVIRKNKLTRAVSDVGEPSRGLFITAGRADYYEGTNVRNSKIEVIEICDNVIDGAGINVAGAYALLDGRGETINNVVSDISIHDNIIKNADVAFTFDGTQIEGRRYDWNFGYPRHDKRWLEDLASDEVTTNITRDNRVEGLTCINNTVDGYCYRINASGANVRGHGIASGNQVVKDIVFRDNNFKVGENHVHVADFIGEDYAHDAGGNEVSKEFLKK